MTSTSFWTSATRCSNSSVSHPTSNSYPSLHFLLVHPSGNPFSVIRIVCHAPSCLAFDSGFGRSRLGHWTLGVAMGYVGEGVQPGQKKALRGRRHPRSRNGCCDEQQAAQTPTRLLSFRFTRIICPYPLSLACSISAFLSYLYITYQICAATFKKSSAQHPITSK